MTTEEQTNPPAGGNNAPVTTAKVFVGNLAFRTRNRGLREAFEKIGTVEGARVVTQGKRSMGYGFVQFASLEDAKKAVEQMHKKPIDEREVNVELSTSAHTNINPTRPKKNSGAAAGGNAPEKKQQTPTQQQQQQKPNNRRRRRPLPRKPKPKAASTSGATPGANAADEAPKPRPPANKRQRRPPREPRPPRELSDTVLYVSNIPFSLEDEGLQDAFKEYNPESANVIRRKRNNLSKGFGFVKFSESKDQQAALDAMHKTKIGEREITVRKAHLRAAIENDSEQNAKQETSELPTSDAPAKTESNPSTETKAD